MARWFAKHGLGWHRALARAWSKVNGRVNKLKGAGYLVIKRGTWCVQVVADRPASAGPEFLFVQSISFERPKQKRAFTPTNN
jgi:hypothetical protein